jgi:hypothetical protein
MILKEEKWIIMSTDGLFVAVGNPRDRHLEATSKTTKRILTYNSKPKAESAFKHSGFYYNEWRSGVGTPQWNVQNLIAVPVTITYHERLV